MKALEFIRWLPSERCAEPSVAHTQKKMMMMMMLRFVGVDVSRAKMTQRNKSFIIHCKVMTERRTDLVGWRRGSFGEKNPLFFQCPRTFSALSNGPALGKAWEIAYSKESTRLTGFLAHLNRQRDELKLIQQLGASVRDRFRWRANWKDIMILVEIRETWSDLAINKLSCCGHWFSEHLSKMNLSLYAWSVSFEYGPHLSDRHRIKLSAFSSSR